MRAGLSWPVSLAGIFSACFRVRLQNTNVALASVVCDRTNPEDVSTDYSAGETLLDERHKAFATCPLRP